MGEIQLETATYDYVVKLNGIRKLTIHNYLSTTLPSLNVKVLVIGSICLKNFNYMPNLEKMIFCNHSKDIIKLYSDNFPKLIELTSFKVILYDFNNIESLWLETSKIKNCHFSKLRKIYLSGVKGKLSTKHALEVEIRHTDVRQTTDVTVVANTRVKNIRSFMSRDNKNKDFNEHGKNKYLAKFLTNYLY
jgi:hypothetical protein